LFESASLITHFLTIELAAAIELEGDPPKAISRFWIPDSEWSREPGKRSMAGGVDSN
jgi:hypothetical protein